MKKIYLIFLLISSCLLAQAYNVTFRVDMQGQTGFTTPELNGTFNGWCGNCNSMTDVNGDGIWETTLFLDPGTYVYKFSADFWSIQENLSPGSSCTTTNSGYTNRILNVSTSVVLPIVCWDWCQSCIELLGCMDPTACNYDSEAFINDGNCNFGGCLNALACNYNPSSMCDNGSCVFPGCNIPNACNFNPVAGCGDGSCIFPGCTDNTACNYNPTTTCDDGFCTYSGCTNPNACNFNPSAGCDNGSCVFPGCNDNNACNFSPLAGCNDGSCNYGGCLNELACNYDSSSMCDNGSCVFPGCTNPSACNFNSLSGCDDGSCILPGCMDLSACNYNPITTCDNGSCTYSGCTNPIACNFNPAAGCDNGSCVFPGCTDNNACNYLPSAGCNNGSCTYSGCTNPNACNFNPSAGCDNGSCVFPGCTDNNACNFNPLAGCNDGSCTYPGCTNSLACNFNSAAGCDNGSCQFTAAPTAGDVNIGALGLTADLTATGNNLYWYDVATGGSPIAAGSTFTTPAITASPTSFWVEDVATFGGAVGTGGKLVNSSGSYFANTPTNFNTFDAMEDVIIDSVFVYSNAAGVRTIQVVDANLTVIAAANINIPNGDSWVELNFVVPAGNGYGLRTTTGNPGLWRDRDISTATPYNFPYDINGLVSITGTTVTNNNQNQDGDNHYYFFYDWHVSTPSFDCPSPRTEVQVMIIPGCNDPMACDYNPTDVSATTCHYPGCTNLLACNYNSNAGCEDGSCYFINGSCNDNNPNTILDAYNSSCNCIGVTYAYGTISTETNNLCPDVSNYVITTNSAPSGMVNYSYQWYFKTGNNTAPAGSSTLGWNLISDATSSSLTVDAFIGTRTYACFVTPDASYGIAGNWMEGAKVLSYSSFAAQTIIGNPNIVPFTSYNYLVNPTPGHTFNWTVVNGAIASGQGTNVTSIIWGQNGPYQVTLTESDGTCSGTSVLFAVNNNCTLAVSAASATTTSFCSGASVQLQAATTATNITYQWYLNGVAIAGETNQNTAATLGGNYQVSITQNGCSAISQILAITELPGITMPTLVVDQANAGCSGSDATVSLTDANYSSITWSNGTVNTSSISVSESGSYSVIVSDSNGCTAASSPVEVNLSLVSAVPICLVTVDQVTGKNNVVWEPVTSDLINSYVVLKETNVANVYAQIGTIAYGSNGLFEDANSNPQVQANRYKLALIDTCGILSSNSDFHKTIHLSTNQGLGNNVNLIWSGYEGFDFGSYNIYRGASAATMTLLTTIASNLDSYTDINPPVGDVYYMIEVEGVSCDPQRTLVYSHSNVITTTTDGIDELSNAISLYPNPATTSINLQVNSELVGKDFIIYDAVGKVILKNKITSTLQTINISELTGGNYILRIDSMNKLFNVTK